MALQFEHPTIAGVTLGGWMNRADAQPKIAQARPPAPERRVAGARRLVGVDAASRQDRAAPRSGRGAPRVDAPGALLLPALSCVVGQLRVSLDRNLRPLWRCTPVWRCTYKSASPECACGRSGCEGALLRGGAVRHGTLWSRNSGGAAGAAQAGAGVGARGRGPGLHHGGGGEARQCQVCVVCARRQGARSPGVSLRPACPSAHRRPGASGKAR